MARNMLDGLNDLKIQNIQALKKIDLPIVMYGAGAYAEVVERYIESNGLSVTAKFVDEHYLKSDGVDYFREIIASYDSFHVVLGIADSRVGYANIAKLNCEKIRSVSHFPLSPLFVDAITPEFVSRHEEDIDRVYGLLCDAESRVAFVSYIRTF